MEYDDRGRVNRGRVGYCFGRVNRGRVGKGRVGLVLLPPPGTHHHPPPLHK